MPGLGRGLLDESKDKLEENEQTVSSNPLVDHGDAEAGHYKAMGEHEKPSTSWVNTFFSYIHPKKAEPKNPNPLKESLLSEEEKEQAKGDHPSP